jgi:hypothetical protein
MRRFFAVLKVDEPNRDSTSTVLAPLQGSPFLLVHHSHEKKGGRVAVGEKNLTLATLDTLAKTLETTISRLLQGIA